MLLSFLGSYYAAVIENQVDFAGRVVVDVGAGSGILSLFAAQVLLMNTIFWFYVLSVFRFAFWNPLIIGT